MMERRGSTRTRQSKPLPLTSENLKKFEKQFQDDPERGLSRRKIPQRTAADGRSAKRSNVSRHSGRKPQQDIRRTVTKTPERTRADRRRSSQSLYRPARESVRRNPEGRSRNPSTIPSPTKPLYKKIEYKEEDLDDHIPYESPKRMAIRRAKAAAKEVAEKAKQEKALTEDYESSSIASSAVTPAFDKKRLPSTTTGGSIRSSTSAGTDDDDMDDILGDDDDEDEEDEEEEEEEEEEELVGNQEENELDPLAPTTHSVQPPIATPAPSTRTHYTSSVNDSLSSIPTVASERPESIISVDEKPPSVFSEAPSYVLNKNEFGMKKLAAKRDRERAKAGRSLTPESAISSWSRRSEYTQLSRSRSRGTATAISRGSYITMRNWSRWSNFSDLGYSISGDYPGYAYKKENNAPRNKAQTRNKNRSNEKGTPLSSRSRASTTHSSRASTTQSRSSRSGRSLKSSNGRKSAGLGNALQIKSYQGRSEPNLRLSKKPRAVLMDGDIVRSRSQSRAAAPSRNGATSRRSVIKADPRSVSLPALKCDYTTNHRQASRSIRRSSKPKKPTKLPTPVAPKAQTNDTRGGNIKSRELENDVWGVEFSDRRKRIPKLKERPNITREETLLSSQASVRRPRRRGRKGQSQEEDNLSTTSRQSHHSRRSTHAQTRKEKRAPSSRSSVLSSVSRSTNNQSRTSMTTTSTFQPRRSRSKQLRPLNYDDSGFISDRCPSSRTSLRPPETPFSLTRARRTSSVRSVVTEYSSYPSRARSRYSRRRRESEASLTSYYSSDGESTAVGPKAEERKPSSKAQPRKTVTPKPTNDSSSDSERLKLPPITPTPSGKSSPYALSLRSVTSSRSKALSSLIEKARQSARKINKQTPEKVFRVNHPMPTFQEAYRDHGMARYVKLARPKESKQVWVTSFWPIRWGDQSMMWPVSKNAIAFKGKPRLEQLASPKKDHRNDHPEMLARDAFQFSCGRSSVVLDVNPLAMKAEASSRVIELAKPKQTVQEFEESKNRTNHVFGCGRSSPIWAVTDGARTAEERERTMQLAQPKKPDARYRPERGPIWPVSPAAQRASSTNRVEQLARPKTRSSDGFFREPSWRVSSSTRRAVASARVQELAKSKQFAEGYQHCRDMETPVPRSALRAVATDRTQTLSKPIVRETMDHVQFNPDAFKVSESALKGKVPDRVMELAQPISRK